jgi:nucleoside 2-deoxyribosyltransferase
MEGKDYFVEVRKIDTIIDRPKRVYLACPYSINGVSSNEVKQHNFEVASKIAAKLMQEGLVVFSPISHSHPIQVHGDMPTNDLSFWMTQDLPFVEFCDVLAVIQLPGWDVSPGVKNELMYAKQLQKEIYYITYDFDEVKIYV